jgi:hypothetical protein
MWIQRQGQIFSLVHCDYNLHYVSVDNQLQWIGKRASELLKSYLARASSLTMTFKPKKIVPEKD